jgi:hypothetical protein
MTTGQCDLCSKDYHLCDEGVLVNPGCIGGSVFEIEFPSGKYAGQVFYLDLKNAYTCYTCLEKQVDEGLGTKKEVEICHLCKKSFSDVHGWDGMSIDSDGCALSWYGSKHDEDRHRYLKLDPSHWYCYPCLDREIDERRTKCLRWTPGRQHNSQQCEHPVDEALE